MLFIISWDWKCGDREEVDLADRKDAAPTFKVRDEAELSTEAVTSELCWYKLQVYSQKYSTVDVYQKKQLLMEI